MDPTEKIIVRLEPDTMAVLQELVDKGEYDSLSEGVSDAINKLIESKFTPKEVAKILSERKRAKPIKMESLLTDEDPESMDDAVRKAVRGYVRSRMDSEE